MIKTDVNNTWLLRGKFSSKWHCWAREARALDRGITYTTTWGCQGLGYRSLWVIMVYVRYVSGHSSSQQRGPLGGGRGSALGQQARVLLDNTHSSRRATHAPFTPTPT